MFYLNDFNYYFSFQNIYLKKFEGSTKNYFKLGLYQ